MRKSFCLLLCTFICFSPLISTATARLYLNEFLASNGSVNMDPDMYNFSDWIEIYNSGSVSVDLGGYYLTDDKNNLTKWEIPESTIVPQNGYILFWADGSDSALHTSFGLSADGESLLLVSPYYVVIDSLTFTAQHYDRSYGRDPDQPSQLYTFDLPTPGRKNHTKGLPATAETASPPRFSQAGGFYDEPVSLTLSCENSSDTIRYTTNGSEPDTSSSIYATPITISATGVIRAKTFSGSRFNSSTATNTYFINTAHSLPVISLAINPDYLWNNTYGIHVKGTNGIVGFLGDTANFYQDWERPLNVELYNDQQEPGFNERAGCEIVGLISRRCDLKGLAIGFKGKYGSGELDYPLFKSRKTSRLKEFILRNSGCSDLAFTHFRDGLMNDILANRMDIDYQAYEPAVIYMNGEYRGILNIREKVNGDYPVMVHDATPDNIDFLETFQEMKLIAGDMDHYDNLIKFINENDMREDASYSYVRSQIDMLEFLNYTIAEMYFCNSDWPGNNVKMWRPKIGPGKWRWIITDTEIGFGLVDYTNYDRDAISRILTSVDDDGDYWNPPWSTVLFRKLMENLPFRHRFIQLFSHYLSTVFDSSSVIATIDSIQTRLEPEMPRHISKWPYFASMDIWNQNVEVLREFARQRPAHCINHIRNIFNLQAPVPVTFTVRQPGCGRIEVNHLPLSSDSCVIPIFPAIPFPVYAIPAPGYRFAGWQGALSSTADSTYHYVLAPASIEAVFVSNEHPILPSVISGNRHLSAAESPYYVQKDVVIDSNVTLSADPGVRIYFADSASIIVYGALHFDGNENRPIILKPDSASFAQSWGALCFPNPTSASRLHHVRLENATKSRGNPKEYFASITAFHTDLDLDHVYVSSSHQPFYAENGTTVITNSSFRSPSTCDLIHFRYGKPRVEHCDLKGNYAIDTDAIDFDAVEEGIIHGNTIHDFYGTNSDAIDIGEQSRDISISDNLIYNCSDKAVSVGQASSASLERNTILFCNLGIGIKDSGSIAQLDRNTFHGNQTAIAVYEKNVGAGGGQAIAKNCILSQSVVSPILVDHLSSLELSYCIVTSDSLPGKSNLTGDPLFVSPETGDFTLRPHSPCIDAGDPESPPDPDSSVADIGAHSFSQKIVINEINYKYQPEFNPGTWIELANPGSDNVNVSGWSLYSPSGKWTVTLEDDQKIPDGSFAVIPGNKKLFETYFKDIRQLAADNDFLLDGNGETLLLQNENGALIDSVTFTDETPWPQQSSKKIQTLSLRSIGADNADAANWYLAEQPGTPGKANSFSAIHQDIVINEINYNASPAFNTGDWVELFNKQPYSVDISGWVLTDDDTDHQYVFPVNTKIGPEDFLVVCRNQYTFSLFFPEVAKTTGDFDFGLGTDIDQVRLFNPEMHLVDSLSFGTSSPWPSQPNGSGTTLELINPLLDNTIPEAWGTSVNTGYGTPGAVNSIYVSIRDTAILKDSSWMTTRLYQNYPNPFSSVTTINCMICPSDSGLIDISLYNIRGQFIKKIKHGNFPFGLYRMHLRADGMANGTYFCRLTTRNAAITKEIIVLK